MCVYSFRGSLRRVPSPVVSSANAVASSCQCTILDLTAGMCVYSFRGAHQMSAFTGSSLPMHSLLHVTPTVVGLSARTCVYFFRNKLRSRPALMSPPTNAFSSASLEPPPGMPPAIGSTKRLGNQENLASPYPISSDLISGSKSAVKQPKREIEERSRVVPPRHSQQPFRVDSDEDSASASSLSSSSSSSSSGVIANGAGLKKASGQGTKATALRAAPRSRSTKDNQVSSSSSTCFLPSGSVLNMAGH